MSKRLVPLINTFGFTDGIIFFCVAFLKKMVVIGLAGIKQIFI